MIPRLAPLLVLFVPLVASATDPGIPDLPHEAYRLPNGLKVVLHRDPAVPRVTVCVAYHVGSKNERAGRTGFAHFFEHMMFRGTPHVPNYDIPLQEAGAQSNAFTTEDMTIYFETVPSDYLERALYLEAERLAFLPAALDREKFDTEREVVKNERRQAIENVPYGTAEETLLAHVFPPGQPYSWPVIGSMRDLDAATPDDLKRFFAEFYHPGNATVCLAGDFDPDQAKGWIATYFGPLAAGPAVRPVEAPRRTIEAVERIRTDDVQLPRVYWAWPTVADDHPDAPALHLLAAVLADGQASRLYRALVRDARIAQDVAAASDTKEAAGLFTLQATAAPGKGSEEIGRVFAAELERVRAAAPTAEELARARAKFEKGVYTAPVTGLVSPLGRAIVLATGFAQKDDPGYYRRDIDRYFRVTPADLGRVAGAYLTPAKVTLLVRPGEPEAEAPGAGPAAGAAPGPALPERTPAPGPDWARLPGPGEPRPVHAPAFVRRTLSNGLDVWIAPWHTLPIAGVRLIVPAGTADDPAGKSGLATLTAALLDQGTRTQTATELAEALEALGVTVSASADTDHTVLGFGVVTRNLEPALGLVGSMLAAPRFDPADVERERDLLLAELLQGPDDPHWIAQRAFRVLLYGRDHPYGNPAQGFSETVAGLRADDVRAFHRDHVAPAGSTLIVVGDVAPEALLRTLEATLGRWTGPRRGRPQPRPPAEAQPEPGVVSLVDKPGAVQSVLLVGRRWVDRADPRYFATLIGNRILGADFLSRLNQNLRERHGYTYGAGSAFSFRRTGSVWLVGTSVRADATAPALKEVLAELDGLAGEKPVTAEEVQAARAAEIRSFPEAFEAPEAIAGALQEMAVFALPPDYLETYLDRLREPRAEAISRAMTEVVAPRDRVVLVVGDRRAVAPRLQELGFRAVRPVTPDGVPSAPR